MQEDDIREDSFYRERHELALGRIRQMAGADGTDPFFIYVKKVASHLLACEELAEILAGEKALAAAGKEASMPAEIWEKRYEILYHDMLPAFYEESFLNPAYAAEQLGSGCGPMLSMLYADLMGLIPWAAEGRFLRILIFEELFIQCVCAVSSGEDEEEKTAALKDALVSFYHDNSETFITESVSDMLTPSPFYYDIIMHSDLSNPLYLHRYGAFIGTNETELSRFLSSLPQEQIDACARTYTQGYRRGFTVTRKDFSGKRLVKIEYPIGFERVIRAAVIQFEQMGLTPVFTREAVFSAQGRSGRKRGVYSTSANRQFDFDHKDDRALYLDSRYVQRHLEVLDQAYRTYEKQAAAFGGPAVTEVFGEPVFTPASKPQAYSCSEEQSALLARQAALAAEITDRYIPGDAYSFTIIAYPLPCIGSRFADIFRETVRINTLDNDQASVIQQRLIDVLDRGEFVRILGRGANRTDMTVHLHPLSDPAAQTNFENCVADVNIPAGEIFTSPLLNKTAGTLFVSHVCLDGVSFSDLEITFQDGMVCDYSCSNFPEDPDKGRRLIFEQILHHHKTLPIGEFAVGTNTAAYRMGIRYKVADRLPILIAEKTGPHFAVGDTCYSHAEDVPMYNPNDKEVIARENEISAERESDPSHAYFGCHTDITLPFDELAEISAVLPDGSAETILRDGRFVTPGCEKLNEPLVQLQKELSQTAEDLPEGMDACLAWRDFLSGEDPMQQEITEILSLPEREKNEEIEDRFGSEISFGTAGLRGIFGVGSSRMNRFTVGRATQGICDFLLAEYDEKRKNSGVVIAYDCRYHSREFAELAAGIFIANGIPVYLYPSVRPTPELSFAVRTLSCVCGLNLTASHNPKQYNGYKVYGEDGAQISGEVSEKITRAIGQLPLLCEKKTVSLDEAEACGMLKDPAPLTDEAYLSYVLSMRMHPDEELSLSVPVVYTPLNGAGSEPLSVVAERRGFTGFRIVKEQQNPDPEFTTVPFPNPENPEAFALAEKLGKSCGAQLLIATDPDSDRMAAEIAVTEEEAEELFCGVKRSSRGYVPLSGNLCGALLIYYLAESQKKNHTLPKKAAMIQSVVTGDLGRRICEAYGIRVVKALTGFKNICGRIPEIEAEGYSYFFGYEESIGCAPSSKVRDKDGICAAELLMEACAFYQKKQKSLCDVIRAIYERFGYQAESPESLVLTGPEGRRQIDGIMEKFRRQPPEAFGGRTVQKTTDLIDGLSDLPPQNALFFDLSGGIWFAMRPSGTEPKLKFYFYGSGEDPKEVSRDLSAVKRDVLAFAGHPYIV